MTFHDYARASTLQGATQTIALGPVAAGRYWLAVPALVMAGSLAGQRTRAPHAGTVPSEGSLFVFIVLATSLLVRARTYFPVLALGPIVEHLTLHP